MKTNNSTITPMKRRLLISIFFIIATIVSSLHELKHIENHDSSSCKICIVDHLSISGDIIVVFEKPLVYAVETITPVAQTLDVLTKKTTNHANAPPLFS